MRLSRRAFGALSLGALGGLMLPRRLAAGTGNDRKFLFVYCVGGWDPTYVYGPMFGSDGVDMEAEGVLASAGGLDFTDAPSRPNVRAFLEANASRTAFVNGMEIRSVTHERCRRILFTGSSGAAADDWPAIAAGNSAGYLLPSLVLSGPSYTESYGGTVVRVGANGQLGPLLDASAFEYAEPRLRGLPTEVDDIVSARVRARVSSRAATAPAGRAQSFLAAYGEALDQSALVAAIAGEVDLTPPDSGGCSRVKDLIGPGITCLERGYSRCVVIQHGGFCDLGWDSHSGIQQQSTNFDLLFDDLAAIFRELDSRIGTSGRPLAEEVTVVVVSEMGRTPKLNATGGKDHWTWTSAMLVGAGITGGRVIGGYDEGLNGRPVDLSTGDVTETGATLTSAHLGATLLAMADLDPGAFLEEDPIAALLG
ncbi:MAG: DUF1501 domain-containing protein [Pseudomonadota bacterium]|nr:DUF1501 domain-containing protein [Pseudomonadota bacterium]